MEDLTTYEASLATADLDPEGCEHCRMPYPYCRCDDEELLWHGRSLLSIWEMAG